ncbi:hypothetical protein HGRIS_005386 [Hohenbuehelia grisea]|uniref:Uncharacterized protein n=1 Tax=Hohenbuehelia grisea TaxID=104357 RepID=A0ABR3JEU0_9AGAR
MERVREARSRRSAAARIHSSESDTGGENGVSRAPGRPDLRPPGAIRPAPSESRKPAGTHALPHISTRSPVLPRSLGRYMVGSSTDELPPPGVSSNSSGSRARGPRGGAPSHAESWEWAATHRQQTRPWDDDGRTEGSEGSWGQRGTSSPTDFRTTRTSEPSEGGNGGGGRRRKRMWAGSEDEDEPSPTTPGEQHIAFHPEPTYAQMRQGSSGDLSGNAARSLPSYMGSSFREAMTISAIKGKDREGYDRHEHDADSEASPTAKGDSDWTRARKPRTRDRKGKLLNEQERKEMLEADEWAKNVQPHSVDCVACNRTFALDTRGRYRATNWYKHRGICGEIIRLARERGDNDL